ncbi:hypothetical protein PsorP6_003226 [Peronosclerospora sorghi]|uniref:Uncharacterized protein n=1 Tax=Peronosclerospora sorghi TaxID=230839 RepID=A0ACC0VN79_9STRA|nr:hypothetical protein PsorP6_003226 [Peronosclerospora sorghi]
MNPGAQTEAVSLLLHRTHHSTKVASLDTVLAKNFYQQSKDSIQHAMGVKRGMGQQQQLQDHRMYPLEVAPV